MEQVSSLGGGDWLSSYFPRASLGFKVAGERSHANSSDASFLPIQRVARASEEESDDGSLAQTRTPVSLLGRYQCAGR